MKILISCDILAKAIKNCINHKAHRILKQYKSFDQNASPDSQIDPQEKINDVISEVFFRNQLVKYTQSLIKLNASSEDDKTYNSSILMSLNLLRLKILHESPFILSESQNSRLTSHSFIKDIVNCAMLDANTLFSCYIHYFQISISPEIDQRVKNDRYCFILPPHHQQLNFQTSDIISIYHQSSSYFNSKQWSYLQLIKQCSNSDPESGRTSIQNNNSSAFSPIKKQKNLEGELREIIVPSVLYRHCEEKGDGSQIQKGEDEKSSILKERYYLPEIEVLNDTVAFLEHVFNGLICVGNEQNVVMEFYLFQIIVNFFVYNDEEQCRMIADQIITFNGHTPLFSPEIFIIVHTWLGILSETRLIECEQNYMTSMMIIHQIFGDPRGRGAVGTAWELFLTFRLSIIQRLQGKILDAEYAEELFDSVAFNLRKNQFNKFKEEQFIYQSPLLPFLSTDYQREQNQQKIEYGRDTQNRFAQKIQSNQKPQTYGNSPDPGHQLIINGNQQSGNDHLKLNTEPSDQVNGQTSNNQIHNNQQERSVKATVEMPKDDPHLNSQNQKIQDGIQNLEKSKNQVQQFDIQGGEPEDNSNNRHNIHNNLFKSEMFKDQDFLPFMHWSNYSAKYDRSSPKLEIINSTLVRNEKMLTWFLRNMFVLGSKIIWQTADTKSFFLSIIQNSFSSVGHSAPSNLSGSSHIFQRQNSRENSTNPKLQQTLNQFDKPFQPAEMTPSPAAFSTIASVMEKQYSTFSQKEAAGVCYSWGQNTDGQLGAIIEGSFEDRSSQLTLQNTRIHFPKLIIPLKDTIIMSVSCGYTHSLAITINRNVLAWGSNQSKQLGLGEQAPAVVLIPTQIPQLSGIIQATCGNDHSMVLDEENNVYTWGQGQGGLLGHGDEIPQSSPKMIEYFKGNSVEDIVCGGLHNLALTKNGAVFSWGCGEGGQLGHSMSQLTTTNEGQVFLTHPQRIRGAIEGIAIKQISAGETHSLVLNEKGQVFGWGYTNAGQLGIGLNEDNFDMHPLGTIQIRQPILIETLNNIKVAGIHAGSMFSMFKTERKQIYTCGLNDNHQIAHEKSAQRKNQVHLDSDPSKPPEFSVPQKVQAFGNDQILTLSSGQNHTLAQILSSSSETRESHYTLYSWGMNKHAQLGVGDIGAYSSMPRPITFFHDQVLIKHMACGAYHSLIIIGDVNNLGKKDIFDKENERQEVKYSLNYYDLQDDYKNVVEFALSNLQNFTPSDEGKIYNPKAINKGNKNSQPD